MKTLVAALALLLCAAPALADIWNPATSTIPTHIVVVGWNGVGADDGTGRFEVVVRDLVSNPVPGSHVVVDFSNAPEMRLGSNPLDGAATLQCPQHMVSKFTDAAGRVQFTIVGAGSNVVAQAGPVTARIYADGVLLGSVPFAILDLDGMNGAGANDVSLWLEDYGTLENRGRGDYDGNGSTGANDLSLWLTAAGTGRSSVSAASFCP